MYQLALSFLALPLGISFDLIPFVLVGHTLIKRLSSSLKSSTVPYIHPQLIFISL